MRRRDEEGQALLVALFVLLLLGVSLALLALSMRIRLEEQQRETRRVHFDLLLDGVVAETLAGLAADPRFPGVAVRSDGSGEAASAVERVRPGLVRIEAEASLGARRARAVALASVAPGPLRLLTWQRGAMASGSAAGAAGAGPGARR